MFRIDGPGATNDNKFTEGDPANGTRATVVTDEWLNAVQAELANAIEAAGIVLSKGENNQLAQGLASSLVTRDVVDVATLRSSSFNPSVTRLNLLGYYGDGTPGGGVFKRKGGGYISSDDNGGTLLVDAAGVGWERSDVQGVHIPSWFGAKEDGVTSDSAAVAAAWNSLPEGGLLAFNGSKTYLFDSSGGTVDPVRGTIICDTQNKANMGLMGNGCVLKVVNHDIAVNNGLLFANFTGCQTPRATDFTFDMSFTGINTDSTKYPFCGGIVFRDESSGTKAQNELCGGIHTSRLKFKLFHPYGTYAKSGAPYNGDENNGYKLFSVTALGDSLATDYNNQNLTFISDDFETLPGHNGYGLWVWAYNDVHINRPKARDFVTRASNADGTYLDGNIPFVRYTQFYCRGIHVNDIDFKALPSSQRTGSFAGRGDAVNFLSNNSAAGLEGGEMVVNGGSVIGGNGDLANATRDKLIACRAYGCFKVVGTFIDGIADSANVISGAAIEYDSELTGGTGFGDVQIINPRLGKNLKRYTSFDFVNGAPVATDRRCKRLMLIDFQSLSQSQYAIDFFNKSGQPFKGAEEIHMHNVHIDGTDSLFGPNDSNSRAMYLASSPGDIIEMSRIRIKDIYTEFHGNALDADTRWTIDGYTPTGTTNRGLGLSSNNAPVMRLVGTGSPEGVEAAGVGSTFLRRDGGAGTAHYVKEANQDSTGWVAK